MVAAVVAGGAAYLKGAAAKKAGAAQKKALDEQERILRNKLDPAALNRLAVTMDRERAINRRKLQEEQDPELAKLRQLGKDELLKEFSRDDNTRESTQVSQALFRENITADPRMEALKDSIINKAQADLDKGATLPAEYQAELVRSGLNVGAGAGVGVSRNAVGGVTSRLLGGAGIQLEAQRTAEAQSLIGTANALTTSRANILSSIFPTIKATEDAKLARAAGAFQIGESTLPQSGLSGSDAVNLEVSRRNAMIAARGKRGEVNAQLAIAQGNTNAAYLQAAGSLATGVIGAYSTPGTGAFGNQPTTPQVGGGGGGIDARSQLNRDAFGKQSAGIAPRVEVGTVPMVGSDFGGANIVYDPQTGQMVDIGQPGYRTPRQQALANRILGVGA